MARQRLSLRKLLVLLLANMLVLLVLAELYFRFVYDASDQFNFIKTSRHWTTRHVRLNHMGMRDRFYDPVDMGIKEKDSVIRIGFFGDSFTFGQGIEHVQDRYTERVCQNLQQKFQANIRCYNVALAGATTRDEWNLIAHESDRLPPFDIIVVQFFANDIEGYLPHEEHLKSESAYGQMLRRMRQYPDHPLAAMLLQGSYAAEFFYFQNLKRPSPEYPSYVEIMKQYYDNEAAWSDLTLQFDKIKQLSTERSIPTGFLLFPAMESITEDHELHFIHERVGVYLNQNGTPYQDLTSAFTDYTTKDLIVNAFDPHPNEKAHALIVDDVQRLVEQLLEHKAALATASAKQKFSEITLQEQQED